MSGGNQALVACPIPFQQWNMVLAASYCEDVFQQQETSQDLGKAEGSKVQQDPHWKSVLHRSGSQTAGGSPSNMTMTLSTQGRRHRCGLGTTLWMFWTGPVKALTWTLSNYLSRPFLQDSRWRGHVTLQAVVFLSGDYWDANWVYCCFFFFFVTSNISYHSHCGSFFTSKQILCLALFFLL